MVIIRDIMNINILKTMSCLWLLLLNANDGTLYSAGRPSTRVVGIKGFDKAGFKIATNSNSAKAKQMVKPFHVNFASRFYKNVN